MPSLAWSRFDQPGHATLYGGSDAATAFLESLAYARPAPLDLASLFDDKAQPIADQWDGLGFMQVGQVPAQWRSDRELSTFRRVRPGVVIDLARDTTIAFLRASISEWWPPRQTLADGNHPVGIAYPSRHGSNRTCYALWIDLPRFAPGTNVADAVAVEYIADASHPIAADNPDLLLAAKHLGLVVF